MVHRPNFKPSSAKRVCIIQHSPEHPGEALSSRTLQRIQEYLSRLVGLSLVKHSMPQLLVGLPGPSHIAHAPPIEDGKRVSKPVNFMVRIFPAVGQIGPNLGDQKRFTVYRHYFWK